MNPQTKKRIDEIIKQYDGTHGALLSVLEDVQKENPNSYLPEEDLAYVARRTGLPYSKIYGVVTFYSFFSLVPQGDHCVSICRGTACHTKGSRKLLEYLRNNYEFESDTGGDAKLFITTKDKKLTVRTVACFGQCALAPVVEVDGRIYGGVTVGGLKSILKEMEGSENEN